LKPLSREQERLVFTKALVADLIREGVVFSSPWLTTRQTSRYIPLSENSLLAMRRNGTGPCWRIVGKRRVVYCKDDVDAWMRERPMNGEK
jgi:hypothetical protein